MQYIELDFGIPTLHTLVFFLRFGGVPYRPESGLVGSVKHLCCTVNRGQTDHCFVQSLMSLTNTSFCAPYRFSTYSERGVLY